MSCLTSWPSTLGDCTRLTTLSNLVEEPESVHRVPILDSERLPGLYNLATPS
jgi:hypothetical protein